MLGVERGINCDVWRLSLVEPGALVGVGGLYRYLWVMVRFFAFLIYGRSGRAQCGGLKNIYVHRRACAVVVFIVYGFVCGCDGR